MVLVYKQARAVIDDRTTIVCLDIHGVMVPVDQPFDTLAGDFMQPPFHVHCRTLVGPHMPGFVAQARKEANAELVSRPKSQRRKGPGGQIGADIPRPVTGNPPLGFSRAVEDHRLAGEDAANKLAPLFSENAKKLAAAGKSGDRDGWWPTPEALPPLPPKPVTAEQAAAMIDAGFVQATAEQQQAVGLYLAGMTWSQDLRAGTASEYTREQVAKVHELIDRQTPFTEAVALYRGMARQYLPDDLEALVGTDLKDPGLLSTSLDRDTAGLFSGATGVLLEIIAPAGSRGVSVNHARFEDQSGVPAEYRAVPTVMGGESEMILKAGTVLRVLQVTRRKTAHGLVQTLQVVIVDE